MKDPIIVTTKENRLKDDIRIFSFGPGVREPGHIMNDGHLGSLPDEFISSGLSLLACIHNVRGRGEDAHRREAGIQIKAIGADPVNVIVQGYQLMTI